MKRSLALFTAALLLSAVPMTVSADEPETTENAEATEASELQYQYGLDAEGNAELYDFIPSDSYEGPVTIPAEIEGHPVDYVGNACFLNAAGITEVTIPASITDMGDDIFLGCTSLQRFYVEEGNPYYSATEDGILLADNGGFLVSYPAAREDSTYEIPASVDEIAPSAFGFAVNLKEITIPEGVNFIDSWAFSYSGLKKITISGSVQLLDDYAFAYCTDLREVNLTTGLDSINNAVFYCDESLKQITLPDTLTYIGQYAFCGTGLSCITIPNSVGEISYCAFGYDKTYKAISDFILYGEPNSAAQVYATDADPENDYENHFNFIAVADGSFPYELGGGMLYEEAFAETEAPPPATDEEGNIVETDENGNPVNPGEELGAGLKDNKKVQLMLGIGGGAAVLLAVILFSAFAKKPKNGDSEKDAEPEKHTEEAETDGNEDEKA